MEVEGTLGRADNWTTFVGDNISIGSEVFFNIVNDSEMGKSQEILIKDVPATGNNRIHYYQDIGQLENGAQYTYSIYVKIISSTRSLTIAVGRNGWSNGSIGTKGISNSQNVGEWVRHETTFTADADTTNARVRLDSNSMSENEYVHLLISDIQVEKKPYPTPFVDGERSAIDGFKDLIGNNHGDLSNMTFDESGMFYNGSTSGITLNEIPAIFQGSLTLSAWVYFNDDSRGVIFGSFSTSNNVNLEKHTSNRLRIYWNSNQIDTFSPNNVVSQNTWHYITFIRDKASNEFKIYVDLQLIHTHLGVGSDITPAGPFRIGKDDRSGITVLNGEIDQIKIYNRALSLQEIRNNYNSMKGRYGF